MASPRAVLLDVGGVLFLPEHDRILGAMSRAEVTVDSGVLDRAHYVGASRFSTDLDAEADWNGCWSRYLDGYTDACAIEDADRPEVHRHLDSEFADSGLWVREAPGCRDGLAALAASGVRLGVVSNADGLIAQRLREQELVQTGPGLGIAMECIIDSGAVGVMKPDARIFRLALEAMTIEAEDAWYVGDMPGIDVVGARRAGLRPFLIDPFGLHGGADYDRIGSLAELARMINAVA